MLRRQTIPAPVLPLLLAVALVLALATVPPAVASSASVVSSAAPAGARFWASTDSVTVGQPTTVAGSLATRQRRPVRIQLRGDDGWTAAGRTVARGRAVWRVSLTPAELGPTRVRAVVPRVRRGRTVLRRVVLAPRVLHVAEVGAPEIDFRMVLPRGRRGVSYAGSVRAVGDPNVTWDLVRGSLPDGLRLDARSGEIRGRPSVAGTRMLTFRATDDEGRQAWTRRPLRIRPA